LIAKLLLLDKNKRLGAGKSGTKNDYNALKKHPFFKGIDFKDMHL